MARRPSVLTLVALAVALFTVPPIVALITWIATSFLVGALAGFLTSAAIFGAMAWWVGARRRAKVVASGLDRTTYRQVRRLRSRRNELPIGAPRQAYRDVVALIERLLPRAPELGLGDPDAHTIYAAAGSYLPSIVDTYLRIPVEERRKPLHGNGTQTAEDAMVSQLGVLRQQLLGVQSRLAAVDGQRLEVHGRFLAEKYATPETLVVPDAAGPRSVPPDAADLLAPPQTAPSAAPRATPRPRS